MNLNSEAIKKNDVEIAINNVSVVFKDNQGNDVNTVFFAICISKVWSDTAVAAPHLIDMRAFITAHIPVWSLPQFDLELVDEAADCGFGNLSVYRNHGGSGIQSAHRYMGSGSDQENLLFCYKNLL